MQQAVKAQAEVAKATAAQLKAREQQLEAAIASDPLNQQANAIAIIDRTREAARKIQANSDEAARTIQMLQAQNVPASDPRMQQAIALRDGTADAARGMRSIADSAVSRLSGTDEQLKQLANIDRTREAARKFQAASDEAARTIQMLKSQDVPASDPRMKVAIAERDALADAASATRSVADSTVSRLLSGTDEQLKQLAIIDRTREAARQFQATSDEAAFTIQVLQAQNVPASDPRMKVAIAERDALADAASATRSAAAGLTDSMVSNSIDKTKVDELNAVRAAIDKLESIAANGSDSE